MLLKFSPSSSNHLEMEHNKSKNKLNVEMQLIDFTGHKITKFLPPANKSRDMIRSCLYLWGKKKIIYKYILSA